MKSDMSNEKQQTSVGQFAEQLASKNLLGIYTYDEMALFEDLLKHFKETEDEQTKSRAVESYYLYTQYLEQLPKVGGATVEMDFEQWYEETYRSNK